jgi:hypothetical protein
MGRMGKRNNAKIWRGSDAAEGRKPSVNSPTTKWNLAMQPSGTQLLQVCNTQKSIWVEFGKEKMRKKRAGRAVGVQRELRAVTTL